MDIEKTRENIRQIDNEISALFQKRMQEVKRVAASKKEASKSVYNREVEADNMHNVLSLIPQDIREYMFPVYQSIMDVSKAYQANLMAEETVPISAIAKACDQRQGPFPLGAKIACQGQEGAYSQLAADRFFKKPVITYFKDFASVFDAVSSSMCEYGVLPIENSTAGSVNEIYDLMQNHKFYITESLRLKVNHNLLVKRVVDSIDKIRQVYSHPQAIAQCKKFLSKHPSIEVIPYSNTAAAAKMVSQSERSDIAAIGSYNCARIYSLSTLAKDIQDFDNNFTRFICISKDLKISKIADRSSFMMILPHTPGSLYRVLSAFYYLGINLSKLESRAMPNRNFEFMFYFDVEMNIDKKDFAALFKLLEGQVEELVYLGSYREII